MCAGIDSNMTENVTVSVNRRRKTTNRAVLQDFTKEVTTFLNISCNAYANDNNSMNWPLFCVCLGAHRSSSTIRSAGCAAKKYHQKKRWVSD